MAEQEVELIGPSKPRFRSRVRSLVSSPTFDGVIGVVIVANSVTIGVEQTFQLEGRDVSAVEMFEPFFLSVYTVELALRFFAFGCECLRDNWVKFDTALVTMSGISIIILKPMLGGTEELAPLMLLRTMRLARLVRTVRLLVKFKVLWMLVLGLLNSASTMFYTLMLLVIILYIFSALGIELIANNSLVEVDAEFRELAHRYFRSLPETMLTLMQFVCLDSVGAIYRPLIEKDGTLSLYFTAIIIFVPIVLMNLVTAVIVNSALEQARQDKETVQVREEQEKETLVQHLRMIFYRLDEDSSGNLSREEIANINENDRQMLCDTMSINDPLEIFNALDVDGNGTIAIDDFCSGISKVALSNAPLEVQRMEKQVNIILKRVKGVRSAQDRIQGRLRQVLQVQQKMRKALGLRSSRGGSDHADERAEPNRQQAPAAPLQEGAPEWAQQLLSHLRGLRRKRLTAASSNETVDQQRVT